MASSSSDTTSRRFSRSLSTGGMSKEIVDGNDADKTFMLRMEELWRENQFCDVTIVVGGEKFAGHRLVLAARSNYFEALFQPGMREGSQSVIELKELMPEYFRLLLSYMYSGRLALTDENLEGVLWTANYLGLELVCQACNRFLLENLTPEGVFDVLELANSYDQLTLQEQVKEYILKNFGPISNRPGFLDWPIELVEEFLRQEDSLHMRNEDGSCLPPMELEAALAGRILDYVRHDKANRLSFLPRALSHVRLGLIESKQLKHLKSRVATVDGAGVCKKTLNNFSRDVKPRASSRFEIRLGRSYANGRYVRGTGDVRILNEESLSPVSGMDISIRRWDERPVVGGLKLFFKDGHEEKIGDLKGPDYYEVRLEDGENIISVQVNSGWLVDRMTFHTDKGRKLGPYGGPGGSQHHPERHIQRPGFGYLLGIKCELVHTQGRHSLTNLVFRWLVYQ